MPNKKFKHQFIMVGNILDQSQVLEKIFEDMGIFDTKLVNTKNKNTFLDYVTKCVKHQYYQKFSISDVELLIDTLDNDIKVSANWAIIPPKNTDKNLSITHFMFRKKEDMEKYFMYQMIGGDYQILN